VRGIDVRIARNQQVLTISYSIEGDIRCLRVPAPRPPAVADELWKHTCCELFVAKKGDPSYWEWNFSPTGEWAAYAFSDYRQRTRGERESPTVADLAAPISVRRVDDRLELEASVQLDSSHGIQLVAALSAVMEEKGGGLSYWALKHPPGKPDFHHRDAFALELE
jgi:hypothetical protein